MKLLFILSLAVLMDGSFAGCVTTQSDSENERRLGLRTARESSHAYGDTDDAIYARIWYGNAVETGQWSDWRLLDINGCDEFQHEAVDYFDDFHSITQRWWAISLYNCGDDGLLLDGLYYWDGSREVYLAYFCPSIAAPFGYCGDGVMSGTSGCGAGSPDTVYTRMWVEGDRLGCNGIVFRTDTDPVQGFVLSHPGKPDCSGETGNAPNNNVNVVTKGYEFESKLLNYLMITIAIGLVLFVSNSCLITVLVKRNILNGYGVAKYSKVDDTDIEKY